MNAKRSQIVFKKFYYALHDCLIFIKNFSISKPLVLTII